MPSFPDPLFLTGAACGAFLLCAGLALGMLLGRRSRQAAAPLPAPDQLAELVAGVIRCASDVASDVSQYRTLVNLVAERTEQLPGEGETPELAVGLLRQLACANELLQQRLEEAEASLQRQAQQMESYVCEARTDALTGLPNRRALDDELARRVAEFERYQRPCTLVMLDVDHFKRLNDTYGHPAGDAVLKQLSGVLRETFRESDLVARYGGEEFAVILPQGGADVTAGAVRRARQAISRHSFRYRNAVIPVTLSFGAADTLLHDDAAALVQRADAALYAAKHAGRNCAFWHDGQTTERLKLGPASDAPAASATAEEAGRETFQVLCADLRRRLHEVALPPVPSCR